MWMNASISNLCMNDYNCDASPSSPAPAPPPPAPSAVVLARNSSTTSSHASHNINNSNNHNNMIRRRPLPSLGNYNNQNTATTTSRSTHLITGEPVNPYHVLQIRQDATPSEIRHSYRRLALWHHPGRNHDSLPERRRRLQVFEAVSASYETLMETESRRRYNLFLKLEAQQCDHISDGLPTGEVFMGGKLLVDSPVDDDDDFDSDGASSISSHSSSSSSRTSINLFDEEEDLDGGGPTTRMEEQDVMTHGLPALSRASSQSTILFDGENEEEDDENHIMILHCRPRKGMAENRNFHRRQGQRRRLGVHISLSDEEAEIHFTEAETNRLFGGPLAPLYRARKWKNFADPFVLFQRIFGSNIFGEFHQNNTDQILQGRMEEWKPLRSTRNAAWMGSSRRLDDGMTTIFTTTRTLHDRRLTRTETVSIDPETRRPQSVLTVTACDLEFSSSASSNTMTAANNLTSTLLGYNGGRQQPPPQQPESYFATDTLDAFLTCYLLNGSSWLGGGEDEGRNGENSAPNTPGIPSLEEDETDGRCSMYNILSPEVFELCWT